MKAIHAVIFDLDGVLWSSGQAHEMAFRQALAEIPGLNSQDFDYRKIAGMRTDAAFTFLFKEAQIELSFESLQSLIAKKRTLAGQLLAHSPPIPPFCREVLKGMRQSFLLALATSSSKENAGLFLDVSGTKELFHVVVSGEAVMRAKPDPEIYMKTLKLLGMPAEKVIAIEDSRAGVQSALRAGLKVAAIIGTEDRKVLEEEGSTWVVDSLAEIEGLL